MTPRHSTFYKTTMILCLHNQGLVSYVVYKGKGSLDTSIIALLCSTVCFISSLLLCINLILIKQDTLIHILEWIEET